jgi:hypothetical protein
MPLFTLVLEYNGGTYICQARATSFRTAPASLVRSLAPGDLKGVGELGLAKLAEQVKETSPTPIEGVLNTWCSSALVAGKLALLHFVQTTE